MEARRRTWAYYSLRVVIPGNALLAGATFYDQHVFLDPGANAGGIVTTNALEAEIRS